MGPNKQFELTLVWRNTEFQPKSIDKVEGDDLVELLAQFLVVLASINRRMMAEHPRSIDDDIPF